MPSDYALILKCLLHRRSGIRLLHQQAGLAPHLGQQALHPLALCAPNPVPRLRFSRSAQPMQVMYPSGSVCQRSSSSRMAAFVILSLGRAGTM